MSIKAMRESLSMTQAELADKVGVARTTVTMWETSEHNPTADKLPALAKALGCRIDDLFEEE